jgi:hypothetical protein
VREESPPDNARLVIRAGPLTVEKLVEHALRQQRDYSYRGEPMPSISVAATVSGWTVERILRERLWSRSTYATATVGAVRGAGFELLPTHRIPHYDIVLATATVEDATTLLTLFDAGRRNPFRRRTR